MGTISVNGTKVAEGRIEKTVPFIFSADETADVGVDEATPVSENYEARGNEFSGKITNVVVGGATAVTPNELPLGKRAAPRSPVEALAMLVLAVLAAATLGMMTDAVTTKAARRRRTAPKGPSASPSRGGLALCSCRRDPAETVS